MKNENGTGPAGLAAGMCLGIDRTGNRRIPEGTIRAEGIKGTGDGADPRTPRERKARRVPFPASPKIRDKARVFILAI